MTPEEYVKQRVDDQISWYGDKSAAAQKWFKRIRGAEIICAAAIPFLAGYGGSSVAAQVAIGVLGAVIVVLASFLSLGQHQENWIGYRTTCESLKHEKYLFLSQVEPYETKERFSLFVRRLENLISKENSAWSQYTQAGGKAPGEQGK
jgi:hypothetical protein